MEAQWKQRRLCLSVNSENKDREETLNTKTSLTEGSRKILILAQKREMGYFPKLPQQPWWRHVWTTCTFYMNKEIILQYYKQYHK